MTDIQEQEDVVLSRLPAARGQLERVMLQVGVSAPNFVKGDTLNTLDRLKNRGFIRYDRNKNIWFRTNVRR